MKHRVTRIYSRCGRIHLGPVLVNGERSDGSEGPVCTHCGGDLSPDQRAQINRTWDVVHDLLRQYKEKRA